MKKQKKEKVYTAIDLFCGVGGVTVGLKKAGFKVLAGVEIDKKICESYVVNHTEVTLLNEDIRKLHGSKVLKELKCKSVDLIVGCPPCQGFSKLTDKYDKEDERNSLVLEMARFVTEAKPKICMMENVPGLVYRGRKLFDEFIRILETAGYKVNWKIVQIANYGIPQSRKRLLLYASLDSVIQLPKESHSKTNSKLKPWVKLEDILTKNNKSVSLSYAIKNGGPEKFNWNVFRDIKQITYERIYHSKPGGSRYELPEELRPDCHKGKRKGFQNVYGRLAFDQTPPTITSGCTTIAMGRFGHPVEHRALSIREAATIQTFPKYYKFKTSTIGLASEMVGNALPCDFAFKATKHLAKHLDEITAK